MENKNENKNESKLLRVMEKNCYHVQGSYCQHNCIISKNGKISSKMLNSYEIYCLLKEDSPLHIIQGQKE
jgi:hypothetical protein